MRLSNKSTRAVLRSFAIATLRAEDGPKHPGDVLVWVEFAPQHPKVLNALWASLVAGSGETLQLRDDEDAYRQVQGLGRRYERFTSDAPRLAGRARPKFLRLVAPEALAIQKPGEAFIALEWPGQTAAQTLAAMLEAGLPFPMRMGWGEYLLAEALAQGCARPLLTSARAPRGYRVSGQTPWADLIADGVRRGQITLDGGAVSTLEPARFSPDESLVEFPVREWPTRRPDLAEVPASRGAQGVNGADPLAHDPIRHPRSPRS